MNKWGSYKAKDLVTFKTGKLDSNASEIDGKYPFFTCAQETYRIGSYAFDTECVLLAGNNAAGIFALKYYRGKFNAYQRTYIIEPKDRNKINTRFLYESFKLYLKSFEQTSTGATTKFLTMGILNNLWLSLPPHPIQRKIAAVLSAYDDLIENNTRRVAILEKMTEEIYREWFVRLRFPGHEKVKIVKAIPEGWVVKRIGDLITFDKGISYKGEYLTETGTPLVNLKCFNLDGTFRLDGVKPYSGKVQSQHKIHEGDIVIANTDLTQSGGIIGNPAIVPKIGNYEEYYYSHHLNAVRFPKEISFTYYFYQLFKSSPFKLYSKGCASGTTVLSFRQGDIEKFAFLYPGRHLAEEYNKIATNVQKQISNLKITNEILSGSRARLLTRLMSGKINVEKMDISFSASMLEEVAVFA